jgi:hypothetical protein
MPNSTPLSVEMTISSSIVVSDFLHDFRVRHGRAKAPSASSRICPGHPRLLSIHAQEVVDARDKPGHDAYF